MSCITMPTIGTSFMSIYIIMQLLTKFLAIMAVAVASNYWMIFPSVLLSGTFIGFRWYYLRTSREIKRLEAIGKFIFLFSLLHGLVHVCTMHGLVSVLHVTCPCVVMHEMCRNTRFCFFQQINFEGFLTFTSLPPKMGAPCPPPPPPPSPYP